MYLFGAKLSIGNDDGKYDKHCNCVLVINAVSKIVIMPFNTEYKKRNTCHNAQYVHLKLLLNERSLNTNLNIFTMKIPIYFSFFCGWKVNLDSEKIVLLVILWMISSASSLSFLTSSLTFISLKIRLSMLLLGKYLNEFNLKYFKNSCIILKKY